MISDSNKMRVGFWLIGIVSYFTAVEGLERIEILRVFFLYLGASLIADTLWCKLAEDLEESG